MGIKNQLITMGAPPCGIPTPEKNMSSSVGMMKFPIYGKVKFIFQTSNQLMILINMYL